MKFECDHPGGLIILEINYPVPEFELAEKIKGGSSGQIFGLRSFG